MNELKFKQLFALARKEPAPTAQEGFDAQVMAAIRRERRLAPVSWWEQLGELFPKLAVAALVVIGTCTVADFCFSSNHEAGATGDLSALSEQLQLTETGE